MRTRTPLPLLAVLTLLAGTALAQRAPDLEGTVFDREGHPVADAEVVLSTGARTSRYPGSAFGGGYRDSIVLGRARTDAAGSFRIERGPIAKCGLGPQEAVTVWRGDGLLINACYRGVSDTYGGPAAMLEVLSPNGKVVGSASSGFARGTFCPASVRVPNSGTIEIRASFDSGPLAGELRAAAKIER